MQLPQPDLPAPELPDGPGPGMLSNVAMRRAHVDNIDND